MHSFTSYMVCYISNGCLPFHPHFITITQYPGSRFPPRGMVDGISFLALVVAELLSQLLSIVNMTSDLLCIVHVVVVICRIYAGLQQCRKVIINILLTHSIIAVILQFTMQTSVRTGRFTITSRAIALS